MESDERLDWGGTFWNVLHLAVDLTMMKDLHLVSTFLSLHHNFRF